MYAWLVRFQELAQGRRLGLALGDGEGQHPVLSRPRRIVAVFDEGRQVHEVARAQR
ncbi:amber mutation suppressing protein [Deinococcus radiodurans R1 = ATCC 13939 = DSM 20539]|uniref:Amber mutation suppressing protein n=1 Tax=Deinococcus radiodurans (strain ATCC 13939 / DSM 20539 / JCM 16871 / CCUG 27074 / LMG 4051 / NBRC 15346 / NCIMB 9279 / VKM B-1422 / R1) TaxID=243230 RepID=Q9RYR3_DEIRA|nr:amber mutation suppressing protein [Deinococcus radiodurans R1 = ATCC 13939 = DSM 20539]